jgi:hypothetical protein
MPRLLGILLLVLLGCSRGSPASISGPDAVGPVHDVSSLRDGEIPLSFFGMHLVSAWSRGTTWPDAPIGVYRLHGATPRWDDLHTGPGRWADDAIAGSGLSRIDAVLLFRERHAPAAIPLYVIGGANNTPGGFPAWVARGDTLAAWREHVRMLGHRYRGRIRHWEVWNEPDCTCFYGGSIPMLARLTEAAAEELRAIDPANVVVSPSFTDGGIRLMAQFLGAGGGRHVDIFAWHQNNHSVPERDSTAIRRVRKIMAANGVGHLPLWTTEGHSNLNPGGDAAGILARTYLTLWAYGVTNFSWYAWDVYDYGPAFPGPWVTLVERGKRDTPTEAGRAYGEIARWMVGARMTEVETSREGTWIVTLDRPAGKAWAIWTTAERPKAVRIPAGVTRVRTLDGGIRDASHDTMYTPTARPVLFVR